MWPFKKSSKSYNWKEEHKRLWDELVPDDGQADTLQGELIRIAGKLTDQAFRNGNQNWDEDHERMWRFVGSKLDDSKVFSTKELKEIKRKIENIIEEWDTPDCDPQTSPYRYISEKVVDWCMANEDLIEHEPNNEIQR